MTSEIYHRCIVALNGDVVNSRVKLNEMYLEEVLKMSTLDLKFILKCHEKGIMGREKETIDAIHTELLERALKNAKTEPDLDAFFEFMEEFKDGKDDKENSSNGGNSVGHGKASP